MGNSNSQSKSFAKDFNHDYSKLKSVKHDTLGDITIYQHKQDQTQVFHKQYLAKSQNEHQYLVDVCTKRNLIYHPHLMRLYAYKTTFKGHSCTSLNKIESYCEFHPNTLQTEINQRQTNKQYLTEQDLMLILYHIVQAIKHLLENQLHVEDIRPGLVFMIPEVKLADRIINLGSQGSYMLAAKQQAKALLAPEQIEQLKNKVAYPTYDASKSDIYQLGMTMLLASTLTTNETFYEQYNLIDQSVENQIEKMNSLYSQFYCRMIKLMLETNPYNRPTIFDVYNVLNNFEKEINQGQPFEVDYMRLSQKQNIA